MLRNTSTKGFSLIELLVVVAIIGIIATIALPLLLTARQRAMDEKARQSVRVVLSAEQAYFAIHGEYGSLSALASSSPPFLDNRFISGSGLLGNDLQITLVLTDGGRGFDLNTNNPAGTEEYTADERMAITTIVN